MKRDGPVGKNILKDEVACQHKHAPHPNADKEHQKKRRWNERVKGAGIILQLMVVNVKRSVETERGEDLNQKRKCKIFLKCTEFRGRQECYIKGEQNNCTAHWKHSGNSVDEWTLDEAFTDAHGVTNRVAK